MAARPYINNIWKKVHDTFGDCAELLAPSSTPHVASVGPKSPARYLGVLGP